MSSDDATMTQPMSAPAVQVKSDRWITFLWLLPVVGLAAWLRFYDLTAAAIWGDEGSSLLLSQYSLADLWVHASHDVHPPLYFMLLKGWIGLFGDGIFSIRLLSALPGIATVLLGAWLVRLIATARAAWLAALLLALLPTAVRYSQEVRMYSLLGLWLLGATIALVYWVRQPQRARYLVVYALLMTAAFYTHYFTALCVLAHWLYLLVIRLTAGERHIERRGWWLTNVAIVLLYLPWVPQLLDLVRHADQLEVGGDVGWEPAVSLFSLPAMVWQFLVQDQSEDLSAAAWGLLPLPLLLLSVASLAAWHDRGRYKFNTLLLIYALLPLLVVFGVSWISPLFIERYLTAYALALPLIMGIAIDRLLPRARLLALGLLVVFAGAEVTGLRNNTNVDPLDQFNVPVNYVNQQYQPGDRIITSDMLWYLSYVYYNTTGEQPMLFTPPTASGASTRPNDYGFGTLVDDSAGNIYIDSLAALPKDARRVWLVSSTDQPYEFAPLPAGWRVVSEQKGGGAMARLYEVCASCPP